MRLGALAHPPQAQLDGFKARALRTEAPAKRDLYMTQWQTLKATDAVQTVLLMLGSVHEWRSHRASGKQPPSTRRGGKWSATVVALSAEHGSSLMLPMIALEAVLTVVQACMSTETALPLWLVGSGTQERHHSAHAGAWGLARSARAEERMPLSCVDGDTPAAFVLCLLQMEYEASIRFHTCVVPRLVDAGRLIVASGTSPSCGAHLISGGTGGLGLLTARWLAQRGCTSVTLISRSGTLAGDSLGELKGIAANHKVATCVQRCDTSEAAHVRCAALFNGTGLFHAAGSLADSILLKQSAAALTHVYAPKVHAAWLLQNAHKSVPLCTHTLFSSVSALLGGAAQANYSAANACLDALASCSSAQSQAVVSVQWGAWAEVGMAARGAAGKRMAALEAASGFGLIDLAHGLWALATAVQPRSTPNLAVVPVQWHRAMNGLVPPAFLSFVMGRGCGSVVRTPSAASAADARRAVVAVSLEAVLQMVKRTAGGVIDADAPLMEGGVDSLGAVELRSLLQQAVGEGIVLSSTLIFDHPTARQVALLVQGRQSKVGGTTRGDAVTQRGEGAHVFVSGLGVALPMGATGMAALHKMASDGCDALRAIPAARWDLERAALDLVGLPPEVAGRVRHCAFLSDAQLFEHGFFGISAAEAAAMDPQQRQLLERGYAGLRVAGMTKASLLGAVVAVNVGQWASEFSKAMVDTAISRSVYASTGFQCSVTCGRVSFVLGLQGPCSSYDTACSASLVGNHSSLRALQGSECDEALSAGVNMLFDPAVMLGNAIASMTSVRGRSHTFDARADGYARGEAVNAVVCGLHECEASIAMQGSAIRQDGRSASLTAPNGQAQQGVLGAALVDAQLGTSQVAILEAHGTGTGLGDPIEAGAIAAMFNELVACVAIGSLKANVGHTEPGAGLAGALKLMDQLRFQITCSNAQLRALNPHVGGALREVSCVLPVQRGGLVAVVQIGGVSSFGYSGTIVHTVLRHQAANAVLPASGSPYMHRYVFVWCSAPHSNLQSHAAVGGRFAVEDLHDQRHESFKQEVRLKRQLCTLAWDDSAKLGVIELNDPDHFNAFSGVLSSDLAKAIEHAKVMANVNGFALQALGPHFCVGGNPYGKHVELPLVVVSHALHVAAQDCCKLRELGRPITAAVHGHLAGGGIALCLNVDFRVADVHTTFEHGNLPRGM